MFRREFLVGVGLGPALGLANTAAQLLAQAKPPAKAPAWTPNQVRIASQLGAGAARIRSTLNANPMLTPRGYFQTLVRFEQNLAGRRGIRFEDLGAFMFQALPRTGTLLVNEAHVATLDAHEFEAQLARVLVHNSDAQRQHDDVLDAQEAEYVAMSALPSLTLPQTLRARELVLRRVAALVEFEVHATDFDAIYRRAQAQREKWNLRKRFQDLTRATPGAEKSYALIEQVASFAGRAPRDWLRSEIFNLHFADSMDGKALVEVGRQQGLDVNNPQVRAGWIRGVFRRFAPSL